MPWQPPVSCICLTYARPALLEEAIQCFLRQDYAGAKELLVLNDYEAQELVCDQPEVRIVNLPKRLRSVGEKMNMAVALASHDLLFVWDDDDIYLPWRLAFSVAHFAPEQGFFKPNQAWVWNDWVLDGPVGNLFHAQSCWTRARFDAVGGYVADGSGYDLAFEQRLAQAFPGSTAPFAIKPEEMFYIYRWRGTSSYHMSAFGAYSAGENVGHREVEAEVRRRAAAGDVHQGRITLAPRWRQAYPELVRAYLDARARTEDANRPLAPG